MLAPCQIEATFWVARMPFIRVSSLNAAERSADHTVSNHSSRPVVVDIESTQPSIPLGLGNGYHP